MDDKKEILIDGNASQRSHKDKLPEVVIDEGRVLLTGRGQESSSDLLGSFPVEYCNPDNPLALENIAPEGFKRALDLDEVWTLLKKNDEFDLQKKVKPTAEQNRLRLAFWREYERAIQTGDPMLEENIYKGIMARENFMHIVQKENRVMAWVLKQPTNYVNAMEESLNFTMHRVREILEMPLYTMITKELPTRDGKIKTMQKRVPDTKVAKLILDTMKFLDMRVKGAIVQKVQQEVRTESRSVNANFNYNADSDAENEESLADIERRIQALTKANR